METTTLQTDLVTLAADWLWEQDENYRFVAFGESARQGALPTQQYLGKTRWEMPLQGVSAAELTTHRHCCEAHLPFDNFEYQLHGVDGQLRWFATSGRPRFAADGRFLGYCGIVHDITRRKHGEIAMQTILAGTASAVGDAFFPSLVSALANGLQVYAAWIGRLDNSQQYMDIIAQFVDGTLQTPNRYLLENTPCAQAQHRGEYACNLDSTVLPGLLPQTAHYHYLGRAIYDTDGQVIGILALLDQQDLQSHKLASMLLQIFAARASAELARICHETELRQAHDILELRVKERTAELEQANTDLARAMTQLVQQEKLAALGNLVAGIAHELNTPLGNALTVATRLQHHWDEFQQHLNNGSVRRSLLQELLSTSHQACDLLQKNLSRASELIRHFKAVAVDQTSARRRSFLLAEIIDEVLITLEPQWHGTLYQWVIDIPPAIHLDSYPGALEQVITNLIHNSLLHGFAQRPHGTIHMQAVLCDSQTVALDYYDDGHGILPAHLHRVFEPFFTTRLGQGGTGLGLYLVHNLVTGVLGGSITLRSAPMAGVHFHMRLPLRAPLAHPEETI